MERVKQHEKEFIHIEKMCLIQFVSMFIGAIWTVYTYNIFSRLTSVSLFDLAYFSIAIGLGVYSYWARIRVDKIE